jgi:hypothetical protein
LKPTSTADIGMDHIAFVAKSRDIAQHGPAGCAHLIGKGVNR